MTGGFCANTIQNNFIFNIQEQTCAATYVAYVGKDVEWCTLLDVVDSSVHVVSMPDNPALWQPWQTLWTQHGGVPSSSKLFVKSR